MCRQCSDLSPLSEERLSQLIKILRLHCPRAFLPLPTDPTGDSDSNLVLDSKPTADLDSFLAQNRPPNPLRQVQAQGQGQGQVSTAAVDDKEVTNRTVRISPFLTCHDLT